MPEESLVDVLKRLEFHLSILTSSQRRSARLAFARDILRTEPRVRMYGLMDGTRTIPDIAKEANVTGQAVRDLLKVLLESEPFVTLESVGSTQKPRRDETVVMDWFIAKEV